MTNKHNIGYAQLAKERGIATRNETLVWAVFAVGLFFLCSNTLNLLIWMGYV